MSGFAGISVPADVISAAQRGCREAHAEIFRRSADAVFTLARRLVVDPAKAEDVLQETFIEVMRSIGGFRGDAAFATWLRHVAVSKALMLLRSSWERRRDTLPDNDRLAAVAESDPLVDRALVGALESLDSASRAVVWLYDVEGYTHVEIAAMMNKSVSYSKSRLARAHVALRERLQSKAGMSPATQETNVVTCFD
ncbi:MAG: sigma-70 family RNA polymerase sigma factor [Pseudomonadota bacterium]